MGSTKDWVMQVEESRREEWIRARLSDPDLNEDSEEWVRLENEHNDYQDFLADMALEEYEEQRWLKQNPHTDIYASAIKLLKEVQDEGKQHYSETFIKMQIAYSVTIMESCLAEMIKSVTLSHYRYVTHAIKNINELKDKSVPIVDLLDEENIPSKYVQDYLSGLLYHRIVIVFEVYKAILMPHKYHKISMKDIIKLVKLRHDIVHRNGKKTDGSSNIFDQQELVKAFSTVEIFLKEMMDLISDAVEYHENELIALDLSD